MLKASLESLAEAKTRFESQKNRDSALVCRVGMHMDCAVMKLQKPTWTNDDLSRMGNQTGFFFSIWVTEESCLTNRAEYNIHAMSIRKLKDYHLGGNEFSKEFRKKLIPTAWPNVSTDFGCTTLMQGWLQVPAKLAAKSYVSLMNRFEVEISPIIDVLLKSRSKRLELAS